MRLGKYFKYLCLLFSGKQGWSRCCLSCQLAQSLGKQPGRQWETPKAPGAEFARTFGKWEMWSWCRQRHWLNPLARDGEPACAPLWVSLGYLRGLGFFYVQMFPICFEMLLVGSEKSVNLGSHKNRSKGRINGNTHLRNLGLKPLKLPAEFCASCAPGVIRLR